jgi:hypothetical protein
MSHLALHENEEPFSPYLAVFGLAVGGAAVVLLDELARDVAMNGVRDPHELSLRRDITSEMLKDERNERH